MPASSPRNVNALPSLSANAAFFIDFDGTLVEIAPRPDLVAVEPRVRDLLTALLDRCDGAVAIVTGRALDVADAFLAPLRLPVAAEHGSVRRDATGMVHREASDGETADAAARALAPLVAANPGLLLERKTSSVALHYRERPDLAEACERAVGETVARIPGLKVLPGKMVFELRLAGVTKGTAVSEFLAEAPFEGRMPVYAGDDVTDEYAFAAVNDAGGISIKIGAGETMARYRVTREEFLRWAESIATKK